MKDVQFTELMYKLEEIRCGIIDVETVSELALIEKPSQIDLIEFQEKFFEALERKTGWGRNEIKTLFNELTNV